MFEQGFIKEYLFGDAELEDIDSYVEYWHTHETNNSLRDFLGITMYLKMVRATPVWERVPAISDSELDALLNISQ